MPTPPGEGRRQSGRRLRDGKDDESPVASTPAKPDTTQDGHQEHLTQSGTPTSSHAGEEAPPAIDNVLKSPEQQAGVPPVDSSNSHENKSTSQELSEDDKKLLEFILRNCTTTKRAEFAKELGKSDRWVDPLHIAGRVVKALLGATHPNVLKQAADRKELFDKILEGKPDDWGVTSGVLQKLIFGSKGVTEAPTKSPYRDHWQKWVDRTIAYLLTEAFVEPPREKDLAWRIYQFFRSENGFFTPNRLGSPCTLYEFAAQLWVWYLCHLLPSAKPKLAIICGQQQESPFKDTDYHERKYVRHALCDFAKAGIETTIFYPSDDSDPLNALTEHSFASEVLKSRACKPGHRLRFFMTPFHQHYVFHPGCTASDVPWLKEAKDTLVPKLLTLRCFSFEEREIKPPIAVHGSTGETTKIVEALSESGWLNDKPHD